MSFSAAFDHLIQSYIDNCNDHNKGLFTYYDSDWPSPCLSQSGEPNELINWLPFKRPEPASLANLESALEVTIPADLQYLFGAYFSHDINAQAADGSLTILQAWNEDDFDRLQKNLIAHVLMKRRLKQADTLFFALTDEDDIILSVDLASQAVMVERVGKEPHKKLADSLAEFITDLRPQPVLVEL